MSGESIYNLLQDEPPPVEKKVFKPRKLADSPNSTRKPAATMGPAKVPTRDPANFLKKMEKTAPLEKSLNRTHKEGTKKDAVPKSTEKPVMGLVTQKDFVKTNKVEATLTAPKKMETTEMDFTKKPDFGKAPKYLDKVKDALKRENELRAEARRAGNKPTMRALTAEEREEMLNGLRANHERVQSVYRQMPVALNTLAHKQRKEEYEKQLDILERDIELLSSQKELLVALD